MRYRVLPSDVENSSRAIAVALLMAPPLGVFAPHALAPLLALSALAVVIRDRWAALRRVLGVRWLFVLLCALSLWCLASAIWSILPEHSLVLALRFLLTSLAGLVVLSAAISLGEEGGDRVRRAAMLGLLIALVLMLIERLSGGAVTRVLAFVPRGTEVYLTRFDRGAVVAVLSLWPVATAQRRLWQALAITVATAVVVIMMMSAAAKAALAVAMAVAAIGWRAPRLVAVTLGGALVLLAIALPVAVPDARTVMVLHDEAPWIKSSGIHRLLIWRFTADRIAERPLLGWGVDASRALPGGHANLGQIWPQAGLGTNAEALPLHPHNAILQWQVELGLPGSTLPLTIIIAALWTVGSRKGLSPPRRAGALAWGAAALVPAMLSYGSWQEWWLASLWLTSASCAAAMAGTPAGAAPAGTRSDAAQLGT